MSHDIKKGFKNAILQSQYEAVRSVNEKQLMLYYGIGKYISLNSREGFWGEGAIDTISERLQKELPGLRGFSARNLRYMRTFYEEWSTLDSNSATDCDTKNYNLALVNAKTPGVSESAIWHLQVPNSNDFPADAFFEIGFTQHRMIFEKIKDRNQRMELRTYYDFALDDYRFLSELKKNGSMVKLQYS